MEIIRLLGFVLLSIAVGVGFMCSIKGLVRPKLVVEKKWIYWHMEGEVDVRWGLPFGLIGFAVWYTGADVSGCLIWTITCGFLGVSLEALFTAATHPWRGYGSTGYLPFYWFAGPVFAGHHPFLFAPVSSLIQFQGDFLADIVVRYFLWGIIFHGMELLAMVFWRAVLGVAHSEVGYLQSPDPIFRGMIRKHFFWLWAFMGFLFELSFRLLQSTG